VSDTTIAALVAIFQLNLMS